MLYGQELNLLGLLIRATLWNCPTGISYRYRSAKLREKHARKLIDTHTLCGVSRS